MTRVDLNKHGCTTYYITVGGFLFLVVSGGIEAAREVLLLGL